MSQRKPLRSSLRSVRAKHKASSWAKAVGSQLGAHWEMCQVILLGDGTVGKTSVSIRFTEGQFTNQYKQTIGVDFFLHRLVLPGKDDTVWLDLDRPGHRARSAHKDRDWACRQGRSR